jgi:hypothetical protein
MGVEELRPELLKSARIVAEIDDLDGYRPGL